MSWVLYALLSAFAASLATIFVKLGIKNFDPTLAATVRSTIACLFLVVTSFAMGKFNHFLPQSLYSKDGVYVLLSGVTGAISWIFYMSALKHGLASQVVSIDRTSIVFIAILSALILGETLHTRSVIGMLLVMAGAYLVTTANGTMMK